MREEKFDDEEIWHTPDENSPVMLKGNSPHKKKINKLNSEIRRNWSNNQVRWLQRDKTLRGMRDEFVREHNRYVKTHPSKISKIFLPKKDTKSAMKSNLKNIGKEFAKGREGGTEFAQRLNRVAKSLKKDDLSTIVNKTSRPKVSNAVRNAELEAKRELEQEMREREKIESDDSEF